MKKPPSALHYLLLSLAENTKTKKKLKTFTYNAPGCAHLLSPFKCDLDINYSFIINYVVMNDWCGMFGEHIGETYLIPPILIKSIQDSTPIQAIENVLLNTHEGIFDYTGQVFKKPKNFNQNEGLSLWYFDVNNPINSMTSPSEFIKLLSNPIEAPSQLQNMSKTICDKVENFIETYAPQIQEISSQIQTSTNEFLDEQKEKFFEAIGGNTINLVTKFVDETFSNLTVENLKNALSCLKKIKVGKNYSEYIKSFDKYFN